MKAKVIRHFTCVNSRVHYAIGSTYEADANRLQTLQDKGYVVIEKELAHVPKAEKAKPKKNEK